jgi:hypothetical protein
MSAGLYLDVGGDPLSRDDPVAGDQEDAVPAVLLEGLELRSRFYRAELVTARTFILMPLVTYA